MEKQSFSPALFFYKFLFITISLIYSQSVFSQCTNPNPTGNISQVFCKSDNSTVENLIASGGVIVWYDAITGGNQYNPSTPLVNNTTYYADDIKDGNCSPNRLEVLVSIYGEPPANVDVFVGKCAIDNPTINDLSATGINIAWYDAQNGGNLLNQSDPLINGFTYWVQQTENGCTSVRLPTTITMIDPPPPTVPQNQTFCSSSNPNVSDLIASETNVVWYESETSTEPLNLNLPLINGKDYWAAQTTFPCEGTIRSKTNVTIDSAPNAGTDGTYSECEVNLTTTNLFELLGGTPDNSGTWTGPSELTGGYLGTFDPSINTQGTYTYSISSILGICPDTSSKVQVEILIVPPPTTLNSNQTFCEDESPTISNLSIAGNGINWYDTESSTTPLNSTDLLVNGEDYWATQTVTNGCESASRLVVNVSFISSPPPTTLNINQIFCKTDNAIISDLSISGNGIIWYDTETSTTPLNPTDFLVNGENYWATQTNASGCASASRLMITTTIVSPPPPTTSEVNQTFCEADKPTITDLSIAGNGINWYDTESSTTPLNSTDILVNGEDYWATQSDVNGCESTIRLLLTVTITSNLPPTTSEANQTFCEADKPTIADLNIDGDEIIWYDTETSTTPLNSTDLLVNEEDYWATQTNTSGCASSSRLMITTTISSPPPPTTLEVNQTFCKIDNPTIEDLNIVGNAISWYATETSTTPLNFTDPLVNGEDYWAAQTNATGCISATRLKIIASIINPEKATTNQINQTFCSVDNPTVESLQVSGDSILWFDTETSTTPLNITDLLKDGEDYWALNYNQITGCESNSKLMITATILEIPSPIINNTSQVFCASDFPKISDLEISETIIWYASESETLPLNSSDLLENGADYWAAQIGSNGCESSDRTAVSVTLNDAGTPTINSSGNEFCANFKPTLSDLNQNVSPLNNGSIVWYDTYPNGTILNLSDYLIDGTTYYAIERNNEGCSSATPLEVTVDLNACEQYDILIYDGFSPNSNGINDSFKIGNLRELYPNFKVEFYNRWGNLIYTSNSSKPDWNGRLNGNDELMPAGVYYFIIYFNKNDKKPIQRRLYLSR